MAKKKKNEIIEVEVEKVDNPEDGFECFKVKEPVILQEPKVSAVARLRALKAAQKMRKE